MNEQKTTVPCASAQGFPQPQGSFREHRQYFYRRHGRFFEIMKYEPPSGSGIMIANPLYPNERYLSQQEARRRVYELNGWPQKQESKPIQF